MHPETEHICNDSADNRVQTENHPGSTVQRGYAFPLDAVVLAGTHRNPKRLICGRNKAFLKVADKALIRYVIDALVDARNIDQIFIVGPAQELRQEFGEVSPKINIIAQRGKMLTNCWAGIEASEAQHGDDPALPIADRPLVIISCDLPLVTGRAVDDFVARCAQEDSVSEVAGAMLVGVVDEPGVKPFHPGEKKPGIKRPFVELAHGRMRLANIYVGRPRNLSRQEFLQTGFSYRKAKDWRNVVLLIFNFFKSPGGWYAAYMTMRVQLTLMLSKRKGWWYRRLKAGNTRERVEKSLSEVLGGPVKIIVTPFGGLSLDVDDQEDFEILDSCYSDWAAITAAVEPRSG